jgi:HlyD family secretion protein
MDIPRKSTARKRRIIRGILIVIVLGGIAAITVGLSRLKPAAPSVEASTLVIDTVKRGLMLRQVRGLGTLVPLEIRFIPATTDGRVERRLVQPGEVVKADTVLLELSNPELEQAALEAEMNLKGAEAEYTNLKVQLESQLLTLRSQAASVQAEYRNAQMQAEANEQLAKEKLISDLIFRQSKVRAEELATRNEIEQKRLEITAESIKAQLAVQQARVEQLRALLQLRRSQVEWLRVRPGIAGVVQEVLVQVGQRIGPGTNLARVADPTRLKAEVRIAETQAKDIQIGQVASIDTRNGLVPGRVIRIDPAVREGTRTVDVQLLGELPKGAVPDLSVDGTIEIERLENIIYVGRPAFGQEKSTVGLFKLTNNGQEAVRAQIKLGRASVQTIEVLEGLKPGDRVILSDMSQWDTHDRVRLN